jgi:hypothetical protein
MRSTVAKLPFKMFSKYLSINHVALAEEVMLEAPQTRIEMTASFLTLLYI